MSFSYASSLENSASLVVQASSNGGGSYTTLTGLTFDEFSNPGSGSKSVDISSYLSGNTRIRVYVTGSETGAGKYDFDFDNFQISYVANTAPTIISDGAGASASVNVAENSTAVTTVSALDGDVPAQTLTYSIIGGADQTKFAIDSGSGALTFIAAPNYESPSDIGGNNIYDVTVQVSDGITTDTQAIAVTVTDFDEFDVGAVTDSDGGTNAVNENAIAGTGVGITASASDADGTTNTITYSLQNDDGGRFTVDSNSGVVTVAGAIDREVDGASRNITVRATSADGSFTDQVFAININDIDEFDVTVPTDADGTTDEVAENVVIGTTVGITADAFDLDATNNTITYSLTSNPDGLFTIDANTGVVTTAAAIDRETHGATRAITVEAASSDGSVASQLLNITINDVDEFDVGAVTDTDLTVNAVDENAATDNVVGVTALAADADATNNAITYTLDDTAGGRFKIDSASGVVTVDNGTLLDREAAASHNITVRATSSDGSFNSAIMTINVNGLNDNAPVIISNGGGAAASLNVQENSTFVTTVTAFDADLPGQTISYSIVGGADAAKFSIDSSTGQLSFLSGPDYEAPTDSGLDGVYDVTVQASDGAGGTDTQAISIVVDDLRVSLDGKTTGSTTGSGLTLSHTSAGDDRLMLVTVSMAHPNGKSVGSITYNGTSLSLVGARGSGDARVEIWGLVAPDLGTHNVVVSLTGSPDEGTVVGVSTFAGVDQTTPLGTFASASGDSASSFLNVASAEDEVVFAGITVDNGDNQNLSPGAGQTEYWDLHRGHANAGASVEDGAATVNMSWNFGDGKPWSVGGISIRPTIATNMPPTIISNGSGDTAGINLAENGTTVTTVSASDANLPAQTLTYSVVGGDDASRFAINSSTGELTFVAAPDFESPLDSDFNNTYEVIVQASDGNGGSDSQTIIATISDVDEFDVGPVSDSDGALNDVDENAIVGTTVGVTAAASDADATNNTITYSLIDSDGGRFAIDSASGVVTVAGAIDRELDGATRNMTVRATSADGSFADQVFAININDLDEFDVGLVSDTDGTSNEVAENAVIGTAVGVTASANDADATTNTITYSLQDNDGGRFAINSATGVVTVAGAIDREADGPTRNITVRATSADSSFTDQVFAININDVDEFDATATTDSDLTWNAVNENATAGTTVGVTGSASDGDATDTITYSLDDNDGGRFAINSATGVVTVAGGIDREADGATRSITVRSTSADASFTTQSFVININDVDEFDVIAVTDSDAATNGVDENATLGTVVGITGSAADADATNNTITYSLQDDDGGRFTINSSTGVVTVAGAIDREADGPTRNITVRATSADSSFIDQVFAININDVDEFDVGPVTDSDVTANTVNENATVGSVVGITALATDADATTNAITYSLDDTAGGRFAINASTGVITVANTALLDYESVTSHNVTVRATSDDTSFSTAAFVINLLDDTSEAGASPISDTDVTSDGIAENAPIGSTIGITALATDSDGTDTISYSLDDDAAGRFAINGSTGVVTLAGGIDAEVATSHNITVRATSTDTSFSTAVFVIAISDVDEFDVAAVTDNDGAVDAVNENAAIGTSVGVTAFGADLDVTNSAISYSLQDNDGGRFAIDSSTGVVTVAGAIDREADGPNRNITVRATSADSSFTDQIFTIGINDIDEFDVGAVTDTNVSSNAVNENATAGTTVGITAAASDADATTNAITYSLFDNDGGRFAIDSSTGVVTVAGAIDREADGPTRNITVRATSADSSFTDQVFTINIDDVDEFDVGTFTDTDVTVDAVDENATIGTVVGIAASAVDADATMNAITYSLLDDDGGRFTINASTGVVSVAASIDREADGPTRNITVRATSADGSFSDQIYAIGINDIDEFDVAAVTDSDVTANVVNENATVGTVVGITAAASDADATNNTIAFSLQDNDGGRFAIDSSTGVVTVAGAIDREADGATRSIVVRATSSDGSTTDQAFSISINDVDEFNVGVVSDIDGTPNAVNENSLIGTFVGITTLATDADATNNTISYSLVDDDGGRFSIDPNSGIVTVAGAIDREADGPIRNITVRATSSDGSTTDQLLTININDVNEFAVGSITDSDATANQVAEDAGLGSVVGMTASATDADATNNMITYSLDDDASGRFAIDSTTGIVTVNAALDHETNSSHNITVRAASSDGSSSTRNFTINVTDVNEFAATPISDVDGTGDQVVENSAIGTTVGITASSDDADGTDTITYSLDNNDGGRFAIDASTGVVTLAGPIDRESDGANRSITVRATSTDGSFRLQSFSIVVADVDEYDVGLVIDSDGAANTINENSIAGTTVALQAFASDADATNNAVSYSFIDNAGGRFAIDANTGIVTAIGSLDFETAASHTVIIQATSADGSVASQAFLIDVLNVNEAPVAFDDGYGTVTGTAITLTGPSPVANDNDVDGDALVIQVVSAPTSGTLTIDAFGNLIYTPDSGFFGNDTITYRADDGSLTSNLATIQITVNAGVATGGDPDPEPTPDLPPPDTDGDDDRITKDNRHDTKSEDDRDPSSDGSTVTQNAQDVSWLEVGISQTSDESVVGSQDPEQEQIGAIRDYFLWQSSRYIETVTLQSLELEMFERLLQLDLEQAIVWQQWDESRMDDEGSTYTFYVGTAGVTASLLSVGYVLWALRGGALLAAISSSLPSWRLVDPAALLGAYRASQSVAGDRVEKMLE